MGFMPLNYRIAIEPDLDAFIFSGHTEILVEAESPVNEITLNAVDLAIRSCRVKVEGGDQKCLFSVSPEKEAVTIFLPGETTGEFTLKIDYMGHINNRMAGFYRSKYVIQGETKYIAVTQFEESDARRAFPCFDHPFRKATFDIEMIVDRDLVALSNGPVVEERLLEGGKKSVRFRQTPRMSTYLLFFGVGEFELEQSPVAPVRTATMPGMTQYAGLGLEFGRMSLAFCEDYYGIEYPLPKLDLIAIPDFAFGAMENWGAITFRENLLLHYPNITSRAGKQRIYEIIAHEIVHQWFGNLVTPSDWKYLWLNESFATYFGYSIVDHYHPEWEIWQQYLHSHTDTALDRDALIETFPIEIPGGEHAIINDSTAPIIYSKGGSILRQVEGYIGSTGFREGLRHYLKEHAYACASSHQLWESLEKASQRPVSSLMKSWVEQKGFPVVHVRRGGGKIFLSQQKFSYLPNQSTREWLIPITVRLFYENGDSRSMAAILDEKEGSIDINDNVVAYKVNDRQTGFYRVFYDDKNDLNELAERMIRKELPPEDRWGLQSDLYALVKSGHTPLEDYLKFLSNYAQEDAFLPLMSISDNLFHAFLVLEGKSREDVASTGMGLFQRALSRIGYEPKVHEQHTASILRDAIMARMVHYGARDVEEFLLDRFASLMKGKTVHPDIMKSVMQIGALKGNRDVLDWFHKRLNITDSEHERINILTALGSFGKLPLIREVRQYVLDEVPNRNKFVPIVSMAANPHAVPHMWDWYASQVDALEQLHPLHYERVIAAIVPVCGIEKKEEVEAFFKGYMARKEPATEVIKVALEKLEIHSRMRNSKFDGLAKSQDYVSSVKRGGNF